MDLLKKINTQIKLLFILSFFVLSCLKIEKKSTSWNVASPDSTLKITAFLQNNQLFYTVLRNADTIIFPSQLGLELNDRSFNDSLEFVSALPEVIINENYTMLLGKQKENLNNAKELTITLENAQKKQISIVLRAYNEGVAFKYVLNDDEDTKKIFLAEKSTFKIDTTSKAWLQTHGLSTDWGPAYEDFYEAKKAGLNSPDSSGYSFPLFFKSKNNWILITESNVNETFCATRIQQNCQNGIYKTRFPAAKDGLGTGNVLPESNLPWTSPWRVIITSSNVGQIVTSNLVHHLADAQIEGDFSWVKPGRSSWSWWGEHDSPKDFKRLKAYVDFSKLMGWEYFLVDANWDLMKNGGDVKMLCDYAKTQNIGILFWYNSGGIHNNVTERPREIMPDAEKRKEEFKKIAAWGVKGIKVDFFQSDKQNIIKLYLDILKDAAAAQIMVNFHGCTLPKGWARTYPNLVSMESVLGAEQYGWSKIFMIKAAAHNVNLAFIRNVVGSMDYTPATFSDYKNQEHQTTNTHELALPVVFESGITHWADREYEYRKMDKNVLSIMSKIPTAWDETVFIEGEPQKHIILARRSGSTWFIAGINGDSTNKDFNIKLPFIKLDSAKVSLFADGKSSRIIDFKENNLNAEKSITVKMTPKGGFVAWIRK